MSKILISGAEKYLPFAIFILLVWAYSPLRASGFLPWDDPAYVLENSDIHQFNFYKFLRETYLGNYHPLTMLFYAFIFKLHGLNAVCFHFYSWLLHLLSGSVVYKISELFLKNKLKSLFVSAFFLLHPAQTESVAWIAELKNVLYAFLFLASLFYFLKYIEKQNITLYYLSLIFFTLSLFSKGQAVAMPVCAFALAYWKKPDWSIKNHIIKIIPHFMLAVLFGLLAIWAQGNDGYINHRHALDITEKTAFASFLYVNYHLKIIFPFPLSAFYPFPSEISGFYYFFLVIPFAFISLTFYLFKKKKNNTLAFLISVAANLILIIQVIPVGEAAMADRYLYLPIFFLSLFVMSILPDLNRLHITAFFIVILAFSFYSKIRNTVFSNEDLFLNDLYNQYPSNEIVLNSYGVRQMELKNYTLATTFLGKACRMDDLYFQAWSNLGQLYNLKDQHDSAIYAYKNCLNAEHTYYPAHYGLSIAYENSGNNEEGLKHIDSALLYQPAQVKYLYLKGIILSNLQKDEEALRAYTQSIQGGLQNENIWINRAVSFGKIGDFNSAMQDLQTAVQLNPRSAYAWFLMGMAKIKLNKNGCSEINKSLQLGYAPASEALKQFCSQ